MRALQSCKARRNLGRYFESYSATIAAGIAAVGNAVAYGGAEDISGGVEDNPGLHNPSACATGERVHHALRPSAAAVGSELIDRSARKTAHICIVRTSKSCAVQITRGIDRNRGVRRQGVGAPEKGVENFGSINAR